MSWCCRSYYVTFFSYQFRYFFAILYLCPFASHCLLLFCCNNTALNEEKINKIGSYTTVSWWQQRNGNFSWLLPTDVNSLENNYGLRENSRDFVHLIRLEWSRNINFLFNSKRCYLWPSEQKLPNRFIAFTITKTFSHSGQYSNVVLFNCMHAEECYVTAIISIVIE